MIIVTSHRAREGRSMTETTADLAIRYGAAWAAHDPDAIVALHTDDTVFHMHGGGDPVQGRPAVREAIVAIFAQAPDLRFDRKTVYFGDGHIVTEYEMCGTAEGVSFACDGVDVFALSDGRIARKDTYLDWGSLQQQLGRDPVAQSQPA
jgi:steroid delta-isomerase-like uncharacterized protein